MIVTLYYNANRGHGRVGWTLVHSQTGCFVHRYPLPQAKSREDAIAIAKVQGLAVPQDQPEDQGVST